MKNVFAIPLIFIMLISFITSLAAQEKVAEGGFQVQPPLGSHVESLNQHWVLMSRPAGGYFLRSEMKDEEEGGRAVQVEELDSQMVPLSIGYEIYEKEQAEPDVSMKCSFASTTITCDGKSEKGSLPQSKPYPYHGPFFFEINDFETLDVEWLMTGMINMAHLSRGKLSIPTITVNGPEEEDSPQNGRDWEFISNDDDAETLVFVGAEKLLFNGVTLTTFHYSLTGGETPIDFWLAQPGILVKMTIDDEIIMLANYHQYKRLIKEIKVEDRNANLKQHEEKKQQ